MRSRIMFILSRKSLTSNDTFPARYASRRSRTLSPVNTNDTRRRSLRSTRASVHPTQCRKLARKMSLVSMACGSAVWYFLDIYATLSGVGDMADRSNFCGWDRKAFFIARKKPVKRFLNVFYYNHKIQPFDVLCKEKPKSGCIFRL